MPDLYFRKDLGCLRPMDDAGTEYLRTVRMGDPVKIKVSKVRNPDHHRKFFALLNLIYENQEHFQSIDELLFALKIRLGYVEKIVLRGNETHLMPKSISFAKMDQVAFDRFYRQAVDFFITEVVPGLNREDLEHEVMEFAW